MNRPPLGTRLSILLRSLTVQGSWNYETLIGTGFAFTLLPMLRTVYRGDPEGLERAIARHAQLFNSHPYLATLAVGAVARLEAERADPATMDRFKNALRGSLGALGDQVVWSSWRPASVLLGVTLILAGAAWWSALLVFLLVYNALHLALRAWGYAVGWETGLQVGASLRQAPLRRFGDRSADVGAFLCGAGVVLAATYGLPLPTAPAELAPYAVAAVAVGVGLWLGDMARLAIKYTIVAAWALAMLLGLFL